MLSQITRQIIYALLTRAPLSLPRRIDHVRLACVRHAASVRSEPGSNSPVYTENLIILFQRNFSRTHNSWRLLFSFQRPSLLPFSLRQNQHYIRFDSVRQLFFSGSDFFRKNQSATVVTVSVWRKLQTIHFSEPSVNLFFRCPYFFLKTCQLPLQPVPFGGSPRQYFFSHRQSTSFFATQNFFPKDPPTAAAVRLPSVEGTRLITPHLFTVKKLLQTFLLGEAHLGEAPFTHLQNILSLTGDF